MIGHRAVHAVFAGLVRTFPREFREAFGAGIHEAACADFDVAWARARIRGAWVGLTIVFDLLKTSAGEWVRPAHRPGRRSPRTRRGAGTMIEQLVREVLYAVRGLIRAPGFTVVALVTLALSIGANVAIFGVVDAVLLEPLPYEAPDRLVSIRASAPGSDFPPEFNVSHEFFEQYRDQADLLADIAMFDDFGTTIRTDQFAERLQTVVATPTFFTMLGVPPLLGRTFGPEDTPFVTVLGHQTWVARFGADSSVIGRAIEVAGDLRTVIGVMGPEFRIPSAETAAWFPMPIDGNLRIGEFFYSVIGRTRTGVTQEDLTTQLTAVVARLPELVGGSANYARLIEQHRPVVRPLRESLIGDIQRPLWVLFGTVGVVLIIACANLANLFAVRAESRRRSIAVRQALGASRGRVIIEQLAEGFLLAGLGGLAGATLAGWGIPLLVRSAPPIPRLDTVQLDGAVLGFTIVIALFTALAVGLAPAVRTAHAPWTEGLRSAGRGGSLGGRRRLGRDALVVGQTALALVVLAGSALLVRSFVQLRNVDPGYDLEGIFSFQVAPSLNDDAPAMSRFHYDLMGQIAALPGVRSVGVVHELPLDEGASQIGFVTEEKAADRDARVTLPFTSVGGDYFETMGISRLQGRNFRRAEQDVNPGVVLISESTARRLWPGENPLGKRLSRAGDVLAWEMVIGIVEDIHQDDLRESNPYMVYYPLVPSVVDAWRVHSPAYVVKTDRAETIASEIRDLVHRVDPGAPFYAVHTMRGLADESMTRLSFTMLTLGVAAGLALVLGAVGLYGVLSYVVSQRTREIGLRMALGATARTVRWMVVRQGGTLAVLGVFLGVAVALLVTRVLETLLFGVDPVDISTFSLVAGVMLMVGLLASYLPARRASAVDPLRSLRVE